MLQAVVSSIKKKLFFYDYCRLTWATRTTLAAIFGLVLSEYFPQYGLWIISSSFIMVQLFSFSPPSFSNVKMLAYGIGLALIASAVSYTATWFLLSWVCISLSIAISFYFFYRGVTAAMISMWSMVMVVLNICLPQSELLITQRCLADIGGVLIAYFTTWLSLPRPSKENPAVQIKALIKVLQHHASYHQALKGLARVKSLVEEAKVAKFSQEEKNKIHAFHQCYLRVFYLLSTLEHALHADDELRRFFQQEYAVAFHALMSFREEYGLK